ncbi:antibiotic biosynthesis monooxygenase [Mesorhizobium temperatum]|uniref:ABM domain-containing protein n=1 Tax=Mesorhizobium temperatum TaxID=241416 RepID=A0A271LLU9_9HYPH|nr:hypothetical protein CIT26_14180 [Mesorhizobium temperatum]
MIMRVYRCSVVAGKEAEFREFAFKKSHPWLRKQPGLIAFYAGRPLPDSGERARCMVQIWESIAAIKAAVGEDWRSGNVVGTLWGSLDQCRARPRSHRLVALAACLWSVCRRFVSTKLRSRQALNPKPPGQRLMRPFLSTGPRWRRSRSTTKTSRSCAAMEAEG